jgi:hypothetical protein
LATQFPAFADPADDLPLPLLQEVRAERVLTQNYHQYPAHNRVHGAIVLGVNKEVRGYPIWGWLFAAVFFGAVLFASVMYVMDDSATCDGRYGRAYDRCVEATEGRWP